MIVIERCTIKTDEVISFLKSNSSKLIRIKGNTFNIAASINSGLQLKGEDIIFSDNTIKADIDKSIKLSPLRNLEMENNKMPGGNSDILHLEFPEDKLESISLRKSHLGRIRPQFIKARVDAIHIEECTVKFDNEKSLVVTAGQVVMANNHILQLVTGALEIHVTHSVSFINNTLDHCQQNAFFDIQPNNNKTKITIENNTFAGVGHAFLRLSPVFESYLDNVQVSNLSLLDSPCTCNLVHDIISDPLDRLGVEDRRLQDLDSIHQTMNQQHQDLEELVTKAVKCLDPNKLTDLVSIMTFLGQDYCSHDHDSPGPPTQELEEQHESDLMWLWIVLGIFGICIIIALIAFLVIRTRTIEKKMRARALSRYFTTMVFSSSSPGSSSPPACLPARRFSPWSVHSPWRWCCVSLCLYTKRMRMMKRRRRRMIRNGVWEGAAL